MKNKIIISVLVFIILVILFTPAKFVQNLMPEKSAINLENISGTVWSGKVERARLQGLVAEGIDYQISFFPLLTATLSGSLSIESGDLIGELDFSASDQENLSVEQASLKIAADKLVNFIPFPGIQLEGELLTNNLNAELVESRVTLLTGSTSWSNSSVTINNQRQMLGNFAIDWSTNEEENIITGRLRKTKNEIDLEGVITLDSAGVAEFKGSISNTADRNLYTALSLFADGKVELGRLPIKFKKKIQ